MKKLVTQLKKGDILTIHGEKLEVKAVRVREGRDGWIYFTDGTKTNTLDGKEYEVEESNELITEDELTDMFGKEGKKKVKRYYAKQS
jgi:phenylalanyl-tRNA synthetase beta subunit